MEVGNWKVVSSSDTKGKPANDKPTLMKRPDGLPCNVQAQYVDYYLSKGYKLMDDPLEFDDEIEASLKVKPKLSKAELRAQKIDAKYTVKQLKGVLGGAGVEYPEAAKKADLVKLVVPIEYAK